MDNLETKIDAWQDSLLDAGAFSEEQLYELEDHLRQKIDDLLANGKTEEQAFAQASVAIGHPVALGQQYSANNSELILKQLLLYFLFGFSLIGGLYLIFPILWQLAGMLFIETGLRGMTLSLALYVPFSLAFVWLLIEILKKPGRLVQLPRSIAHNSNSKLSILLTGIIVFLLASSLLYFEWFSDNDLIGVEDYLLHSFTQVSNIFSGFLFLGIRIGAVVLFFSLALDHIRKHNSLENSWNKLCLAAMMGGFLFINQIGGLFRPVIFQYLTNSDSYANWRNMVHYDRFVFILLFSLISAISLFAFRHFHKKGQLLAQS